MTQEQIDKHYMYVLECSDSTYYTGYTTCVEQRISTHDAGKGAKYTRGRGPVKLIAQAMFSSKHEAMSAEYRFKRLSRPEKEELLKQAQTEPLEAILTRLISEY